MFKEIQLDLGITTTPVKVGITKIKYFNSESNEVIDVTVVGRYTVLECKKIVTSWNDANKLISKENANDEFRVSSLSLIALKDA